MKPFDMMKFISYPDLSQFINCLFNVCVSSISDSLTKSTKVNPSFYHIRVSVSLHTRL